jgi:hypothetical protein
MASSPTNMAKDTATPGFAEKDFQNSVMTPRGKAKKLGKQLKESTRTSVKKGDANGRQTDKRKLLSSLNDLADQLTKPSIAGEDNK